MQADLAATDGHSPTTARLSLARYLAKVLVADQGYDEGTVPEAAPLATASDLVLTKTDGMSISIVCIVDGELDAGRQFGLDAAATLEVARACRDRYAGTVSGAKMPATVEIVEVRRRVTQQDLERLAPIRSRRGCVVTAYAVDLSASTVAVNAWSLLSWRRRFLRRLLTGPRRGERELVRPAAAALPENSGRPLLTYLLLAIIGGVFAVELLFPVAAMGGLLAPDISTLVALGGLLRPLVVDHGEWFRLFTSALLHADPLHLALNGLSLWMAGVVLEHLLGRAWLFALFFVGALGGSLLSLTVNPSGTVSIGASGAIMCLLAATFVSSFRLPGGAGRTRLQVELSRVLVPSLLPIAVVGAGGRIDFAGHLGGALVGFLIGGVLLATWPRSLPRPRFAGIARALAAAGVLAFGFSGYQVGATYRQHALVKLLIPKDRMPKTDDEAAARAEALVKSHPRDPRAHMFSAMAAARAGDLPKAERHARAALAEEEMIRRYFKPEFEVLLRSVLADVLLAQNRREDARREVAPVCSAGPGGATPERLRKLGLCPER